MKKRILIAEDEQATREMITMFAKTKGYDVVAVSDGIELLTFASNEKFDVIITDLLMTDLDGAAATEIIKMKGNTTPVIALTVLSHKETALIQDKFSRIFYKPCNFSELFGYIESLLEE